MPRLLAQRCFPKRRFLIGVLALAPLAFASSYVAADDPPAAPPATTPAAATPAPAPAPPAPPAPPLHEQIDTLVESTAIGPLAPPAADAEFLRRAYLDLNGTIPDATTARAFLDDANPDKRTALIDRLLASPQFARQMQRVFDVMWMERRVDKDIPIPALQTWQDYLLTSFRDNKPLDQLTREILSADGVEPTQRAAARFYLARDGEANLLTRDIGRLFFGRDMQCAQCHDHPLVNDYHQAEYYGLSAFVSRGTVFNDLKAKQAYYAELADGEVNYKSVFTGDARDRVIPELPTGTPVSEPMLAKEEQYVVAPAKEVRPVPKYSRRARLAQLATDGSNPLFNRNLANRLWSILFGRGIVHPLDMQHSDNPPVQSQLLALMSDELVRGKFALRPFLRELALTRAYQRTSELPAPEALKLEPASVATTLAAWKTECDRLGGELPTLEKAAGEATAALTTAYDVFAKAATAREAVEKTRLEAKKATDDLSAALATAIKDAAAKDEVVKVLVAARVAADAAAAKLPEDKQLAEAAGTFKNKANEADTQLVAIRQTVTEKTPQVQAASLKLAETDKALEAATAVVAPARAAIETADATTRTALDKFRASRQTHNELVRRTADAQRALDYQAQQAKLIAAQQAAQTATEQLATLQTQTSVTDEQRQQATTAVEATQAALAQEQAAATSAWNELVERANVRFMVAGLRPLAPEQLAAATMQAVGLTEAQRAALVEQATKDAEAAPGVAPEARPALVERLLEERVDEKLRGNLGSFVSLFGQQPGQPAGFAATVHQALFLSNGGLLAGWLNPGGNNLTDRLAKLEDPSAVSDELYLSVLTRRPSADEAAEVARYWEATKADRAAAARELVWSLLTCAEFRFNH